MTVAVQGTVPRCAGLVGLGLIGTSIGLALRHAGWRTVGFDVRTEHSHRALEKGALDEVVGSVDLLGSPSIDLVIVCVPPRATVAMVEAVLAAGATAVTDVASVKAFVVGALGSGPRFIGGHPMAGSEKAGPDGARPDLFQGAHWVLTPSPETSTRTADLVVEAVEALGAEPVMLEPRAHDRAVALVSHLPHIAAAALVSVVAHDPHATELGRLAATGWRDTTRVASGSPVLWGDIVVSNAGAVVPAIDKLIVELVAIRDLVGAGDVEAVRDRLGCAATARDGMLTPGGPRPDDPPCTCALPDAG
jgi:prephenate dehydrogenase